MIILFTESSASAGKFYGSEHPKVEDAIRRVLRTTVLEKDGISFVNGLKKARFYWTGEFKTKNIFQRMRMSIPKLEDYYRQQRYICFEQKVSLSWIRVRRWIHYNKIKCIYEDSETIALVTK